MPTELPSLDPALGQELVPAGAACAHHVGVPAVATCRRCGTFICADDLVLLDGSRFCRDCSARPDVDYLEAFRLKYWGKRDSWAWFFGVTSLVNALTGLATIAGTLPNPQEAGPTMLGMAAALLLWSVCAGAFWAGARWSRVALPLGILMYGAVQVFALGPVGLATVVVPLAFIGSALSSVRTKLFFELDVPREQLRKAWSLLHDNVVARNALTLGVAGLLVPLFGPIAIVLGGIGLRRVDPAAHPPVGRRGQAIAGIVLGVIGTLAWGALGIGVALNKL